MAITLLSQLQKKFSNSVVMHFMIFITVNAIIGVLSYAVCSVVTKLIMKALTYHAVYPYPYKLDGPCVGDVCYTITSPLQANQVPAWQTPDLNAIAIDAYNSCDNSTFTIRDQVVKILGPDRSGLSLVEKYESAGLGNFLVRWLTSKLYRIYNNHPALSAIDALLADMAQQYCIVKPELVFMVLDVPAIEAFIPMYHSDTIVFTVDVLFMSDGDIRGIVSHEFMHIKQFTNGRSLEETNIEAEADFGATLSGNGKCLLHALSNLLEFDPHSVATKFKSFDQQVVFPSAFVTGSDYPEDYDRISMIASHISRIA